MNHRLQSVVGWARQALLTGGAVLGAVCLLAAVAAAFFGVRPLVFLSGSMSPAIETGALGFAHEVPASSLAPGDVVSVPTESGERVTHRIVTIAMDGDEAELSLRGDANATDDADTYRVTHADRVLFDVPLVGYAIGWLMGPIGLFLLGLYAAFLVPIVFRRDPPQPESPQPSRRKEADDFSPPRTRGPDRTTGTPGNSSNSGDSGRGSGDSCRGGVHTLSVVAALGLVGATAFTFRPVPTSAAWIDRVDVTGTALTADTVTAPTLSCFGFSNRTYFIWPAVPSATNYTLSFSDGKLPVTLTDRFYTDTMPAANRTARVVARREFGLPVTTTWVSASSNTVKETSSNGSCG